MNPRIIGISGPTSRNVVEIGEGETTIGRRSASHAIVSDPTVSRRHCRILRQAETIEIEDLESENGTFVNGKLVERSPLTHGDEIAVGGALFMYLTDGERESPSLDVRLDDSGLSNATVSMRVDAGDFLRARSAGDSRDVRELQTLLEICSTLLPESGLEALAQRLVELLMQAVPARRGAVFVRHPDSMDFPLVYGFDPRTSGGSMLVSQSLLRRVVEERQAMVCNDIDSLDLNESTGAFRSASVRSFLAVPLCVIDQVTGVVYLDTDNAKVRFDERHVQLLTAVCRAVSIPIDTAQRLQSLKHYNERLERELDLNSEPVGESEAFRRVMERVSTAALTNSPVLLTGESGSGKTLLAREIHRLGSTADAPFVVIRCSEVSEESVARDLFGYERGTFSGLQGRPGALESPVGGTVFLAEIGELSPLLQRKLLGLLETNTFQRVGGEEPRRSTVRVIASTALVSDEALNDGRFRRDLFYRLGEFRIDVPSLALREGDAEVLAAHFAGQHEPSADRNTLVSPRAAAVLARYVWPGNVRELKNIVSQAMATKSGDRIDVEDLPDSLVESTATDDQPVTPYHDAVLKARRQIVVDAIERNGYNYTEAAERLGINRTYLHRLVNNLGLRERLTEKQEKYLLGKLIN